MQSQLKSRCINLSPCMYISADNGVGEEKVISQGKCISYLVALLEARLAAVRSPVEGRHKGLLIKA